MDNLNFPITVKYMKQYKLLMEHLAKLGYRWRDTGDPTGYMPMCFPSIPIKIKNPYDKVIIFEKVQ